MLCKISKVYELLISSLHSFGSICFFSAMLAFVFIGVVWRYVFNSPLLWCDEVTTSLFACAIFSSMIACWDAGRHIRMDIIYNLFHGKARSIADILDTLAGGFVLSLLAVAFYDGAMTMYVTNEIGENSGVPFWIIKTYLGLIAVLFVVRLISQMITSFGNLLRPKNSHALTGFGDVSEIPCKVHSTNLKEQAR